MEVVEIIISIIIGGLVLGALVKIGFGIYSAVKRHDYLDTKYKVSFKKHFTKIKVPLIKMKIAGELKYFLVDSGATNNIIASDFFESLDKMYYTDLNYSQTAVGIGGTSEEMPFIESSLSFKQDHFEDVPFMVADIAKAQELIKHASNITIVGILGNTFFTKYKWMIDFDQRCIWINSQNTNKKDE